MRCVTIGRVVLPLALTLSGCFSMSPVPPEDGLSRVTGKDMQPGKIVVRGGSGLIGSDWTGPVILVRPTLNEKDVGWFIVDTGASGWTISAAAAAAAGLRPMGWALMQGEDRTTVFRCDRAQVGAIEFQSLSLAGLNMHHAHSAFGQEVVGICGRELFSDAVVEFDGPTRSVRVHDPATFALPTGAVWQQVEMHQDLPHVRCRIGNRADALMVIDTGCDQEVFLLGTAADEHSLREFETGQNRTQVSYGQSRRVTVAEIPEFEFCDQKLGPVRAILGPPGDPVAATLRNAAGVIGLPLLRQGVLLLDLGNDRAAFVIQRPVPMAGWPISGVHDCENDECDDDSGGGRPDGCNRGGDCGRPCGTARVGATDGASRTRERLRVGSRAAE